MLCLILGTILLSYGQEGSLSTDELDERVAQVRRNKMMCGPVSMWYVLRRCGRDVTLDEVVRRSQFDEHGLSLEELLELARLFGIEGKAIQVQPPYIKGLPIPTILVVGPSHCVVLDGPENDGHVPIFEPGRGRVIRVSLTDLQKSWSGTTIIFAEPELSALPFFVTICLTALAVGGLGVLVLRLRSPSSPGAVTFQPSERGTLTSPGEARIPGSSDKSPSGKE